MSEANQTTIFAPRERPRLTPCMICGSAPLYELRSLPGVLRPLPICERLSCLEEAERMFRND